MQKAYYNECDPKAAAWLRELIKAGLIMDGVVDERSIADVSPDDVMGYRRCHFFSGIAGWELALQLAGSTDQRNIWTGSAPCQPFSAAGQRKATKDERHLWPEFSRLIKACQPEIAFGEQVASSEVVGTQLEAAFIAAVQSADYATANRCANKLVKTQSLGAEPRWVDGVRADLEAAGYAFQFHVLGAHSVNAPNIRQRLFWVADSGCESSQRGAGGFSSPQAGINSSRQQDGRLPNRLADGGEDRGLPNANGNGCDQTGLSLATAGSDGTVGTREPDRLEHAAGDGWQPRRAEPERGSVGCGCRDGGTGDSASHDERRPSVSAMHREGQSTGGSGCDNWSDFNFIPCGDGKTRRLKPGIEPLAHGLPRGVVPSCNISESYALNTAEARVMRLSGYGNTINPYTAAEFIAAFIETENQVFESEPRTVQLSQFELDNE